MTMTPIIKEALLKYIDVFTFSFGCKYANGHVLYKHNACVINVSFLHFY